MHDSLSLRNELLYFYDVQCIMDVYVVLNWNDLRVSK